MNIFISIIISLLILILMSAVLNIHPFLSITLSCYIFGIIHGIEIEIFLENFLAGFGGTISKIGFIITLSMILGMFMEQSGSVEKISESILKITGYKYSSFGLLVISYIISLSIFSSSSAILLLPIAKRISSKTKESMVKLTSIVVNTLTTTHLLIPLTSGPMAGAKILDLDLGLSIIIGFIVSIPVLFILYFISNYFGKKYPYYIKEDIEKYYKEDKSKISLFESLLPIIVILLLILNKTIFNILDIKNNFFANIADGLGYPEIALMIGIIIAFLIYIKVDTKGLESIKNNGNINDVLKNAGNLILIIGVGGAFGSVLSSTSLKEILLNLSSHLNLFSILIPFIIAMLFKTIIGSGTTAFILAINISLPLLDNLGLSSELGKIILMLACGSGAYMVFHGNDSYFWITVNSSGIDVKTAYKVFPLISIIQGITTFIIVLVLYFLYMQFL